MEPPPDSPSVSTAAKKRRGRGKAKALAANAEASSSGSTASKRKAKEPAADPKKKAKTTPAQDENTAAIVEGLPTADLDKVAIIHYNVLKVQASIATTNNQTAKIQAETAKLQADIAKREEATQIERGTNLVRIMGIQKMLENSGATNVNIVQVLEAAFGREKLIGTATTGSSGVAVPGTSAGLVGGGMFMQPGGGGFMMPVMMNGPNGPQMWMNPQGGQNS